MLNSYSLIKNPIKEKIISIGKWKAVLFVPLQLSVLQHVVLVPVPNIILPPSTQEDEQDLVIVSIPPAAITDFFKNKQIFFK